MNDRPPAPPQSQVMTVQGPIESAEMGKALTHEHILVDFIGAAGSDKSRWNHDDVIAKMLPYLKEVREKGFQTFVDCTPNHVGRDAELLQKLSRLSGLHILTNTGFYGGSDPKYLPEAAFAENAGQLAGRWIREWREGIDGTSIRPGFIKISVNDGPLSEMSKKLASAAALAHLETGLAIASHTGPAVPAFEQIAILRAAGVAPSAFIWVHAQNEPDWLRTSEAARLGAWVSLDGLSDANVDLYVQMLGHLKGEKQLGRTLISHDAGWFQPGVAGGGKVRGYGTLAEKLIPALRKDGFSEEDIRLLIEENPRDAFAVRVRAGV